jgi:predicted Mrr-cat superfamily restriction endonuclease
MKSWLVNTNSKQENENPHGFKYMLRQNKAAAFYDRSGTIDKIEKGDLILLYHNQNRVIAVGAVFVAFSGHDFIDIENVEHWVDVNWLWKSEFDVQDNPKNYIDRNNIGITMVNNTVVNITDQVNYKKLFEEIANKQNFWL